MYYILYLEALSGGPSWVFSINQSINPRTLSQSPHGTSPPKLTSPMSVSKVQNPHKDPPPPNINISNLCPPTPPYNLILLSSSAHNKKYSKFWLAPRHVGWI